MRNESHLDEHLQLYESNRHAANVVSRLLLDARRIASVLDAGCGIGTWLQAFETAGVVDVLGIEREIIGEQFLKVASHKIVHSDLRDGLFLDRKFDLSLCLEVAEHLEQEHASTLVSILARHSDLILFSAAIRGQGGIHHVNEQPLTYWSALFEQEAFEIVDCIRPVIWNDQKIPAWYRQNVVLFVKRDSPNLRLFRSTIRKTRTLIDLAHPDLLEHAGREVSQLHAENESLRTNQLQRKAQLGQLNDTLKERDGEIAELNERLRVQDVEIGQVSRLNAENAMLRTNLLQREAQIAQLDDGLRGREQEITELNERLRMQDVEIGQISQLNAESAVLRTSLVQSEAQIGQLEKRLQGREWEFEELDQRFRMQDVEMRTLSRELLAIQRRAHPDDDSKEIQPYLARIRSSIHADFTSLFHGLLRIALSARYRRTHRGIYAVIAKSKLFDRDWYLKQNPDVAAVRLDPVLHYILHGAAEGRDPHPLFDTSYYLKCNRDVAEAGVNPLAHFIMHGSSEGRDPHPFFDTSFYLQQYPDIAAAGVNPLKHYLSHGGRELRNPAEFFSTEFYTKQNPDIDFSSLNPLIHFVSVGVWQCTSFNSTVARARTKG